MTDYVLEFPQPQAVPSENEARRAAFGSRGRAIGLSRQLNEWKSAAFYAWKRQRSGPVGSILETPCEVEVHIGFVFKRRRDPHNYVGTVVKSIVDGLVLAHVWPDDTPEWVKVRDPVLEVVGTKLPPGITLQTSVMFYPMGGPPMSNQGGK